MTTTSAFALEPDDQTPLLALSSGIQSRGDLARAGDSLARAMGETGVSRVMVQSDNPFDILRSIDAASRTGADLFIAHTNLPAANIDAVIDKFGVQMVTGETDRMTGKTPASPANARIFMMTSGTTGAPKIASHSLPALMSRARAAMHPGNRGAKWLLTYQPTGFAGVQVQLTGVIGRGVIVAPQERTPAGFLEAAKANGVTQISATPTFWRAFLMAVRPDDLDLRQITLGGEAADQTTLDRIRKAFPNARITHIYASTEAGVVFSVHDGLEGFPAEWLEKKTQGVSLRVRDGFLHIHTPNAMSGYASDTAQPRRDDGWLVTADRVEIRGDRAFIVGRDDSTINVAGSKVYPLMVEQFLLTHPGVVEAHVYGVANPISGQLVAADIVLEPDMDATATRSAILKACRENLAQYQVPRALKIVDAIAVRESGKKG
jgi:acyl-coenzyme A synthetase/AMP-(fatty) acid ligase